jgi:16S rRNA (cytidine1402-2'-O)-methyltransferase
MFEEYWRGKVTGAVHHFKSQPPRGEFTLVIEGKRENGNLKWTEEELVKAIEREMKAEKSAKEISAELVKPSGWNKRDIYSLINSLK